MEKFQEGTEGGLDRSGHLWRMERESVVVDVGDTGTSGGMRHGEMCNGPIGSCGLVP